MNKYLLIIVLLSVGVRCSLHGCENGTDKATALANHGFFMEDGEDDPRGKAYDLAEEQLKAFSNNSRSTAHAMPSPNEFNSTGRQPIIKEKHTEDLKAAPSMFNQGPDEAKVDKATPPLTSTHTVKTVVQAQANRKSMLHNLKKPYWIIGGIVGIVIITVGCKWLYKKYCKRHMS